MLVLMLCENFYKYIESFVLFRTQNRGWCNCSAACFQHVPNNCFFGFLQTSHVLIEKTYQSFCVLCGHTKYALNIFFEWDFIVHRFFGDFLNRLSIQIKTVIKVVWITEFKFSKKCFNLRNVKKNKSTFFSNNVNHMNFSVCSRN